jgi:co-chaperonin GroES (HSP10)
VIVTNYNFVNMTPKNNKIFIIPIAEPETTLSGISISTPQLKKGKVLFVSEGTPDKPMEIKVDDIILYERDCGLPFNYNNQQGLFLQDTEVITIL